MKQKVSCHEGKCWEEKEEATPYFDELFEDGSIVDQIEKDLWGNQLYGR